MKKRHRYHGIRGTIGSVLLAAGWLGIWLLWPIRPPARIERRVPTRTATSYVRVQSWRDQLHLMPDYFARSISPIDSEDTIEDDMMSAIVGSVLPPPEPLAMAPDDLRGEGWTRPNTLAERATTALGRYHDPAPPPHAFLNNTPEPRGVSVSVAPVLRQRGMTLPDFADSGANETRRWAVTAFVEIDEDGLIDNVIVESGCEDPSINAKVARHLTLGRANGNGPRVAGRVTISNNGR